jgi:hypothetical protein
LPDAQITAMKLEKLRLKEKIVSLEQHIADLKGPQSDAEIVRFPDTGISTVNEQFDTNTDEPAWSAQGIGV